MDGRTGVIAVSSVRTAWALRRVFQALGRAAGRTAVLTDMRVCLKVPGLPLMQVHPRPNVFVRLLMPSSKGRVG